jgi:hypothetical protein
LPSCDIWSMMNSETEHIIKAGLKDLQWRFESLQYRETCLVFWVLQQRYESRGGNTGKV